MTRNISQSNPKANKDHFCDASMFLCEKSIDELRGCKFSFSEWRAIINAKNNDWKIKKGDKYTYQVNEYEGKIFVFKAITEIHDICCKYDYYQE